MLTNRQQLTAIHTLLHKNNLKDQKESIVSAFTAGRTTSSKEMKSSEAAALIGHLKSLDKIENSSFKMRNKVLSMAHEMYWVKKSGSGVMIIDMDHVNNWCIKNSYLKKRLDDYQYEELPKLVSQFEEVYKSYLKAL